ncbi:hypothetical protein C6Q28_17030 [Burkholderia multivorans]|uniref:Bacteriophage protein n=1 Tax=Burkholderia multivorans TaxID=87883 RepID=A0A2S9MXI0_9BURK|nr:hypothetical protein C6Q28_17030 [Burkholderia multivorans]PRF64249.1 hypothetical protein C6Q15_06295 [Burkholderia multivorans]
MFHTIGYKGHFIHVSIERGVETVQTQIMRNDGGFDLERRRTLVSARRAITKHVQNRDRTEQSA